jgi:pyrimidine operon attenuation protein/uracil phosphoribosyltransferase
MFCWLKISEFSLKYNPEIFFQNSRQDKLILVQNRNCTKHFCMKILEHKQIEQKVSRLAIEILEHNIEEEGLILAGINNRGMALAQMLAERMQKISKLPIRLTNIRLNPAAPMERPVEIDLAIAELEGKVIIVVDDVASSGRTLLYACKPILETLPKKLEIAVLVDRTHKSFPVRVDYVGLSLATTLKENILVEIGEGEMSAFLE